MLPKGASEESKSGVLYSPKIDFQSNKLITKQIVFFET
jgi:hypothetical protein